jgi:hypothetical protein
MVEVGAFGFGPQQFSVDLEGNAEVLIDGSVPERHVKSCPLLVVSHLCEHGGLYRYGVYRERRSGIMGHTW